MTYCEALIAGWKPADTKWTVGYVSRKSFCLDEAVCHEAGGTRKGQLYILAPSWDSTQFCYRHYLTKE